MHWTAQHNDAFVKEMLLFEPWLYRKGTPERGNIWKAIAESLNQLKDPYFKVTDRSLRNGFKNMEKTYISKRNQIEKASGIDVPEKSEAKKGLADIIEQFIDCEAKAADLHAADREVTQAEKFRKQSVRQRKEHIFVALIVQIFASDLDTYVGKKIVFKENTTQKDCQL